MQRLNRGEFKHALLSLLAVILTGCIWATVVLTQQFTAKKLPFALGPIGIAFGIVLGYHLFSLIRGEDVRFLRSALLLNPAASLIAASLGLLFWSEERISLLSLLAVGLAGLSLIASMVLLLVHLVKNPTGSTIEE